MDLFYLPEKQSETLWLLPLVAEKLQNDCLTGLKRGRYSILPVEVFAAFSCGSRTKTVAVQAAN
jgi:hypothetical protein